MLSEECGALRDLLEADGFAPMDAEELISCAKEAAPDGEEPWDILEEENLAGRAGDGLLTYLREVRHA